MSAAWLELHVALAMRLDAKEAYRLMNNYQAEVLRKAADALDGSERLRDLTDDHMADVNAAATELRHRADKVETTDGPAEATVYRASHDSILMGRYTTEAAAREHCVAELRREWPNSVLDWIEDEEDGVTELVAMTADGEETETGYVVTPLEVASEYDPEADE